MRLILLTQDIIGCLNVQHNCHRFNCPVTLSRQATLERQATGVKTVQVEHLYDSHFIINTAALRNQQLHSDISNLTFSPITPDAWIECVNAGFDVWEQTPDEEDITLQDNDEEDFDIEQDDEDFSDDYSDLD